MKGPVMFGKKTSTPPQDCPRCDGTGRIDTGERSKWTGAKFATCPACGGSGVK